MRNIYDYESDRGTETDIGLKVFLHCPASKCQRLVNKCKTRLFCGKFTTFVQNFSKTNLFLMTGKRFNKNVNIYLTLKLHPKASVITFKNIKYYCINKKNLK